MPGWGFSMQIAEEKPDWVKFTLICVSTASGLSLSGYGL
jgi:hypothetical protein